MSVISTLHQQVWTRFVRLPQGHLLDYADQIGDAPIPTPADCTRCMPNPLGWWTPIENGAFFTGLYAYALLSAPNGDPQEIRTLLNGLRLLQDVSRRDGFIARGVATDGAAHYPFSSEDQVAPWLLAMNAYRTSRFCPESERQEIAGRLLRTLRGLKDCGWAVPTEREGMISNAWGENHDWRGVVKLLYCARLLYELTGDKSALEEYVFLRDSIPKDWFFTRKEIASHGFAHDMVQQRSLVQSWIFTCAHLCLRELCRLDPDAAPDYAEGLHLNGITSVRMIDNMLTYDNRADGFDLNWRRLEPLWQPLGDRVQPAVDNALRMGEYWNEHIVPHRKMEHDLLGFSLFSAWIAATCGDVHIETVARQKLMQNCIQIDWKTLHNSYAFAAESALICR